MVFWRNEVAKKAIVAEDNGAASAAATGGGWGKRWTILRSVALQKGMAARTGSLERHRRTPVHPPGEVGSSIYSTVVY